MAPRPRHEPLRPSLPKGLLEELDHAENNAHGRRKGGQSNSSRKEARKQERLGKKQRKAVFFSAAPTAAKRVAEEEHAESPKRKRAKVAPPEATAPVPQAPSTAGKRKPQTLETSAKQITTKPKIKHRTALEKLAGRSGSGTSALKASRSQRDVAEDSYIEYLESKLGYSGGKGKKGDDEDGLDDLLDFTSTLALPQSEEEESDVPSEDEAESTVSDDPIDGAPADEWTGFTEEAEENLETHSPVAPTRYVPPHLRDRPSEVDDKDLETIVKLRRQLKGLLNRMSEQNMSNILDSIEEVYRKHKRHDVSSTLTTLIIDGISSHSSLLDSYVVLYAAFVSSLHKIVGVEFAAYFVQHVVSAYEQHHTADQATSASTSSPDSKSQDDHGKECANLIVLLSELYNFQVISSVLIFDVVRELLSGPLAESDVELLLKIVRGSGAQLRTDDPSALKDIIQTIQTKLGEQDGALSSRTRFMVETLTNLKNNKVKQRAGAQNQGGEAVERMKKFLSGLTKKKHVLAHEPLRVSLEDLRKAGERGKWWLVGAAWGGDPLAERQAETDANVASTASGKKGKEMDSENALLKLARKQGMNTDVRRSIFVVLMSSDDYVDACERLGQLNLTDVQQREIIRVILHCCGNEKSYNPYYTLVAQHLSRTSHSYKVTLQFCLWDFLRDLGETGVGGAEVIKNLKDDHGGGFDVKNISATRLRNVARAYAWWIAKDACTLTILKPVDFTVLKPQTQTFLREMFAQIFIASQVSTPLLGSIPTTRNKGPLEEVFIKTSRVEGLAAGIIYFLSETFRDDEEKLFRWASGVAKETLRTSMDVVPSMDL